MLIHGRRQRLIVMLSLLASLLAGAGLVPGVRTASASTPAQQAPLLTYGMVVRGHISDSMVEETWRFRGRAGDWVLIDMRAIGSGFDVSLTLKGPDSTQLVTDDDGGPGFNARIGPYELPADGEYTILAGHYSGAGDYTLDLRDLGTIPALAPGKPLVGVVTADQPNTVFMLDLPPNAASETMWQLDIHNDDDDDTGPFMALYGKDIFIDSTEELPDSLTLDPVIPSPGETYFVVVSWNANYPGGSYTIALHESTLELLADGVSQTSYLNMLTTTQTHYFRAGEGDIIRVTVRTRDDIAPALEIYGMNSDDYLYFNEGDFTRELRITLEIPTTAVYAIHVRDASFSGNRGEYTIDFEVIGN